MADYPFSQINADGMVTDLIYGNNGVVHGATLDTVHYSTPPASLLFNGTNANVTIPPASQLSIKQDLIVSAAIRPTAFRTAIIVGKANEYELALRPDGTVAFIVKTSTGTFTATTPDPVTMGEWSSVVGIFSNNQVQVFAGSSSAQVSCSGTITPTSSSLTVGAFDNGGTYSAFFGGNIDAVSIGVMALFTITGGSPGGTILIGNDGTATIDINASGPEQGDANPIGSFVIAATVYDQDGNKVDDVDETFHRIDIDFYNRLVSGLSQDVLDIVHGAEELVSALLAIGSIKLVFKTLAGRGCHGWQDYLKVGLAVLDIAVTYGSIVAKPLALAWKTVVVKGTEGAVTKLAAIAAILSKGAFAAEEATILEKYAPVMQWLNGTAAFEIAEKVLLSEREIRGLNDLITKGGEELAEAIMSKASAYTPDVGRKMIESLSPLSKDIIKEIGVADETLDGLAKTLNANLDGARLTEALENAALFPSGGYYKRAQFLVDMGKVSPVRGAEKLLGGLFRANNLGHRYELEFASSLIPNPGVSEIDRTVAWLQPSGKLVDTDIDIVALDGIHYQCKRSKNAFKKSIEWEMSYANAIGRSAGGMKNVVYVSTAQSNLKRGFLTRLRMAGGDFKQFNPP